MLRVIEERTVGALSHLIVLLSVLFLVFRVLQVPLFPVVAYWFLVPNAALALIYVWRSRVAFRNIAQAFTIHLWALLLMGGQPWFWRSLKEWGLLSEKWFMTGAGPYHIFAAWSVMALLLVLGSLFVFTATIDAMISAAYGRPFEYWFFGRMATRFSTWLESLRDDGDETVKA